MSAARTATAPTPIRRGPRPAEVRWARERNWLEVWDPELRVWHQIWANDAPYDWRRLASAAKQAERDGLIG